MPGKAKENQDKPQCPGRKSNQAPQEYSPERYCNVSPPGGLCNCLDPIVPDVLPTECQMDSPHFKSYRSRMLPPRAAVP